MADHDPKTEWALETAGGDADKAAGLLKEESDYVVFDQLPFWSNGAGVTNGHRDRLYYKGGEVTAITDCYTNVKIGRCWMPAAGYCLSLTVLNRRKKRPRN